MGGILGHLFKNPGGEASRGDSDFALLDFAELKIELLAVSIACDCLYLVAVTYNRSASAAVGLADVFWSPISGAVLNGG